MAPAFLCLFEKGVLSKKQPFASRFCIQTLTLCRLSKTIQAPHSSLELGFGRLERREAVGQHLNLLQRWSVHALTSSGLKPKVPRRAAS